MTRRAQEGEAVRKRREIAQNAQKCTHKKEPVRIARTPRNHQKSATKCNIKKNGEQRANKEESAILQHDNTGVGRMLRELVNTIRARQIRTFRTP